MVVYGLNEITQVSTVLGLPKCLINGVTFFKVKRLRWYVSSCLLYLASPLLGSCWKLLVRPDCQVKLAKATQAQGVPTGSAAAAGDLGRSPANPPTLSPVRHSTAQETKTHLKPL